MHISEITTLVVISTDCIDVRDDDGHSIGVGKQSTTLYLRCVIVPRVFVMKCNVYFKTFVLNIMRYVT